MNLYEIIKKLVLQSSNDIDSGGKGPVKKTKIDKVEIEFQDTNDNQITYTIKEGLEEILRYLDSVKALYVPEPNYFSSIIG